MIVGLDPGDAGFAAVSHAADLAQRHDLPLRLVHAFEPSQFAVREMLDWAPEVEGSLRTSAGGFVLDQVAGLGPLVVAEYRCDFLLGDYRRVLERRHRFIDHRNDRGDVGLRVPRPQHHKRLPRGVQGPDDEAGLAAQARTFCTTGLVAGISIRDMQYAMRHADPRRRRLPGRHEHRLPDCWPLAHRETQPALPSGCDVG